MYYCFIYYIHQGKKNNSNANIPNNHKHTQRRNKLSIYMILSFTKLYYYTCNYTAIHTREKK